MRRSNCDSHCFRVEKLGRCANCWQDLALFDTMCIPCTTQHILTDYDAPYAMNNYIDEITVMHAVSLPGPHDGDEQRMLETFEIPQMERNPKSRNPRWLLYQSGPHRENLLSLDPVMHYSNGRVVAMENCQSSMSALPAPTNEHLHPFQHLLYEPAYRPVLPEPSLDPFSQQFQPTLGQATMQIFPYHPALEQVPCMSCDPTFHIDGQHVPLDLATGMTGYPGQAQGPEQRGNLSHLYTAPTAC